MFASFLPGVRHLRAPFFGGCLWVLFSWLLIEPRLPPRSQATGLYLSLTTLLDTLSVFGSGFVLIFSAYLLGTISESVFGPSMRKLVSLGARSVYVVDESYRLAAFLPELTAVQVFATSYFSQFSPRSAASLFAIVDRKVALALLRLGTLDIHASTVVEPVFQSVYRSLATADQEKPGYSKPPGLQDTPVPPSETMRRRLVIAYCGSIAADLEGMAVQLIGREDGLYAAIDRYRSEVELRQAIIPPVVALMVLTAFSGIDWWAVGCLLILFLWDQATHAAEAATNLTVDAIVLDRLTVPELERIANLTDYVKQDIVDHSADQVAAPAVMKQNGTSPDLMDTHGTAHARASAPP